MATYIYRCADCGAGFNVQATLQEKEERKGAKFSCPECHSENVAQEFSVVNFVKNVFRGDEKSCGCCKSKCK